MNLSRDNFNGIEIEVILENDFSFNPHLVILRQLLQPNLKRIKGTLV